MCGAKLVDNHEREVFVVFVDVSGRLAHGYIVGHALGLVGKSKLFGPDQQRFVGEVPDAYAAASVPAGAEVTALGAR